MKQDFLRLIKYLLFPLYLVVEIFWLIFAIVAGILWVMRFTTWCNYPTMPFEYLINKWHNLTK